MSRRSYRQMCLDMAKRLHCEVREECNIVTPPGWHFTALRDSQAFVDMHGYTDHEAWKIMWSFMKDGLISDPSYWKARRRIFC